MFSQEDLHGIKHETKLIPYVIAKNKPDKEGRSVCITPVSWEGVEIVREKVTLQTIGEIEIIKKPFLTRGYEMVEHDETLELLLKIYDGRKTYTPEYVDKAKSDVEYLADNKYVINATCDYIGIGIINEEECVSFLQDDKNPNIIRYHYWLDNLSRQWLEAFVKAGFLIAHNHVGTGEYLAVYAGTLFDHKFDLDFMREDKSFIEINEFYADSYINPPRRCPTDNDVLSLNLGFRNIILSRLEAHQTVLASLHNQLR